MSRFGLLVSQGEIPGHIPVNKFGFNGAVSSTEETIWARGGVINWPPAAAQMKVSSGDAKDTILGVGARNLHIYGLDADWEPQDEVVELDGQSQVTTLGTYIRVNVAEVELVGAELDNAGVIYVYTGTASSGVPTVATTIYTSVEIGEGRTLQAAYTIPNGCTGYLYPMFASTFGNANVGITVRLKARERADLANTPFTTREKFVLGRNSWTLDHEHGPVPYPGRTDLMVTGQSGGVDGDVSVAFDIILIEDTP